jgi:hypothetical protein
MRLQARLADRRAEVLARWRALVVERAPHAGRVGRAGPLDPFHDPVGVSLWRTTAALVEALCADDALAAAATCLDELVRIRSVQELSAPDAVRFVFQLRTAIRDVLEDDLAQASCEERAPLDERVDALALHAFDAYVRSREKLSELRAREVVSRSYVLVERARRLVEEREPTAPDGAGGGSP